MTVPISTRRDVAISAYHRTVSPDNSFLILLPGDQFDIFCENGLGTDELYPTIDDANFPDSNTSFENVLGHLVDISIYSLQAGIEVYIHEGVHNGGGQWIQSDAFMVTPGVGAFERGFRLSAAGWRIRIVNGGLVTVFGDVSVRISTM